MKKKRRRVRDPQRGNSFGLEFPYLYIREGDEFLVYKAPFVKRNPTTHEHKGRTYVMFAGGRKGGEVVASYSIVRHGECRAEDLASKRTQKLNGLRGPDSVDLAAIDATE